jgi:hypothetical protein
MLPTITSVLCAVYKISPIRFWRPLEICHIVLDLIESRTVDGSDASIGSRLNTGARRSYEASRKTGMVDMRMRSIVPTCLDECL